MLGRLRTTDVEGPDGSVTVARGFFACVRRGPAAVQKQGGVGCLGTGEAYPVRLG